MTGLPYAAPTAAAAFHAARHGVVPWQTTQCRSTPKDRPEYRHDCDSMRRKRVRRPKSVLGAQTGGCLAPHPDRSCDTSITANLARAIALRPRQKSGAAARNGQSSSCSCRCLRVSFHRYAFAGFSAAARNSSSVVRRCVRSSTITRATPAVFAWVKSSGMTRKSRTCLRHGTPIVALASTPSRVRTRPSCAACARLRR